MSKDEHKISPKSVIILPGVGQEKPELQVQSLPGADDIELPEPIKDYLQIRSQKPNYRLSVLAALFFIAPFLTLGLSDTFILDDFFNLAPICCLFFLISIILFSTNRSQYDNWKEEMKKARKQIKQTEQIPYPPETQWPLVVGTLFLFGGFVWIGANPLLFFTESILGLTCFLYYFYITHRRNTIYDALIEDRINNPKPASTSEEE